MKNPLFRPLWISALGLYLTLLICKKVGIYIPFVSDYLADFLAMPVVLPIALAGVRIANPRNNRFRFHWIEVLLLVAFWSLLFEVVFPRLGNTATADPWDVLAYALGGVFFYLVLNEQKPPNKEQP